MSRGFGKYRRGGGTHASFHFDNLFKENSNKPSAARSAATVGKWGITSFTSIRSIVSNNDAAAAAPKPKKFFKSRNTDPPDLNDTIDVYKPSSPPYSPPKRSRITYEPSDRTTRAHSPRKFFSSKTSAPTEKTVLSSNVNKCNSEPPKPPIVLRICRGKSQLLNDSDESESTPTPSSTPSTSTVTSPRALKDSSRPANCRITRSARRSMQQDPSSSPATADTPGEFSLFTSPKADNDLSPQYIPAEKYELERKAMYDNLLKPNSPKDTSFEDTFDAIDQSNSIQTDNENKRKRQKEESEEEGEKEMEIEEPLKDTIEEPKPVEQVVQEERKEDSEEENEEDQLEMETHNEATLAIGEEAAVASPNPEGGQVTEPEPPKEISKSIDEEWSTDTDSNSTAPEMEVKQILPDPNYTVNTIRDHKEEILDKILEKPLEPAPPVKLVISKKKGSIFKSRTLIDESGSKKRRALYTHKWTDDNKEIDKEANKSEENAETNTAIEDAFGFVDAPLERVINDSENGEITSIRCNKGDKSVSILIVLLYKIHIVLLILLFAYILYPINITILLLLNNVAIID